VADFHLKSLASGLSPVGSKATFEEGPVCAKRTLCDRQLGNSRD
jgi:hypothetical protein